MRTRFARETIKLCMCLETHVLIELLEIRRSVFAASRHAQKTALTGVVHREFGLGKAGNILLTRCGCTAGSI